MPFQHLTGDMMMTQFSSWALFWVVVSANDDDDDGAQRTQTVVKLGGLEGDFLWGALAISFVLGFVLFYVCSTKIVHCFKSLPVRAEMLRSDTFVDRLTKTIKLQGGELKYVSRVDLPTKDTISLERSQTSRSTTSTSNVTTTSFTSTSKQNTLRVRPRKVARVACGTSDDDDEDDVTPPLTADARPIITPKKVVVIPLRDKEIRQTPELLQDQNSVPQLTPSNNRISKSNNNHVKQIDNDDEDNNNSITNNHTTKKKKKKKKTNHSNHNSHTDHINANDDDDDDTISSDSGSVNNHNHNSTFIPNRDLHDNNNNHNNDNNNNNNNNIYVNRANRNHHHNHGNLMNTPRSKFGRNRIQPQTSLCTRQRQRSTKRGYDLDNSTPAAQAWVTGVTSAPLKLNTTPGVGATVTPSHSHRRSKYAQASLRHNVGVARTADDFVW